MNNKMSLIKHKRTISRPIKLLKNMKHNCRLRVYVLMYFTASAY